MATDLPELAERHATGAVAAIYAEIRRLGGVPMVALIFRHLATLPGALEWAWAALAPAWQSGRLQEAAWRTARALPLTPMAALPSPVLAVLEVDGAAHEEINDVLLAYNRANPENLLSVLCLLRLLGGHTGRGCGIPGRWAPPPAPLRLPAMADPGTLSPALHALLQLVAAPGPPGSPRVVQSLYRHFTHRPAFLALAVTLLRQRHDDGSIDRAVSQLGVAMAEAADEIAGQLTAPAAPHAGIAPVCSRFAGGVIPQMIVVGRLLDAAINGTERGVVVPGIA